ncbi:MAG TPA: hypothetical protein DCR71_00010 [Dehalococcoidia bacterium]|nr:hypothetical protein [Dehalococcoidia bacterium]
MEPNRSRECEGWIVNSEYDNFRKKFNPYDKDIQKNCGTCSHFGGLGCDIHANVFKVYKD